VQVHGRWIIHRSKVDDFKLNRRGRGRPPKKA
jgi:hypothetical protein